MKLFAPASLGALLSAFQSSTSAASLRANSLALTKPVWPLIEMRNHSPPAT